MMADDEVDTVWQTELAGMDYHNCPGDEASLDNGTKILKKRIMPWRLTNYCGKSSDLTDLTGSSGITCAARIMENGWVMDY